MSERLALVVDDDPPVRTYVTVILQRDGFKAVEAVDGADALSLAEQLGGSLDLIVTDWEMPRMNGGDFIAQIRAKYPDIPVVFISAYASVPDSERLINPENACTFLPKPFSPAQLLETVRKIAGRRNPAGVSTIASPA